LFGCHSAGPDSVGPNVGDQPLEGPSPLGPHMAFGPAERGPPRPSSKIAPLCAAGYTLVNDYNNSMFSFMNLPRSCTALVSALALGCSGSAPSTEANLGAQMDAYLSDLNFIALPRPSGSAHWQKTQDFCVEKLEQLGFAVSRQDYGTGVNVIALKAGRGNPAEQVLISAHYDSTENCPGADDNASGTAGVLEIARILAPLSFERTLVVALWDEEERDLIGSRAYAEAAKNRGDKIVVSIVLEMIGAKDSAPNTQKLPAGFGTLFPDVEAEVRAGEFRADFLANVFNSSAKEVGGVIDRHAENLGLPVLSVAVPPELQSSPYAADLRRSDHSAFWDAGFPAIMLTDTSEFRYPFYHCRGGADAVARLDHSFSLSVIGSVAQALTEVLRRVDSAGD